jgi:glycosyltransferase involved in cell wall biosynthesis
MYLARKRGIKYIIRPIGQLENWSLQQSRLRKLVFLRLFEQSNIEQAKGIHFTAQSEFEQARMALPRISNDRVSNREIMIIPLGINPPKVIDDARSKVVERYNLDPKNKILLFLSRVHPKKGLELLFGALSNLEQTNCHLIIAGDGDPNYVEELEATSKKLGITRQCQFIGYQDGKEKQELLQGSDLYLLTSHSENFGIAVLEALAAGTPVLISQGVALAELVSGKKLGYTCEIDIVSIQSQLKYCLDKENEHELATLGQRSAQHIQEHYQWTTIAERLKSSYQNILEL